MKNATAFDCIGLGISPADYICLLDHYPHADEKMHAQAFSKQGGGPISTAMAALGRWGLRAALISNAGQDHDGQFVVSDLQGHGVDTRFVRLLRGARTPRAFIWVDTRTGSRSVVLDSTAAPQIHARDIILRHLPPTRAVHTDGRDTQACLKLLRHARVTGAATILDAGSPRPRMDDITALVEYFVASQNFIKKTMGPRIKPETACRRILDHGPRIAIVTLDADGCCGATKDGAVFRIPGHRRKAFIVDTNGAGDIFHAGYIYALLQGWPADRCAAFANAAAFLKCGRPGGRQGIAPVKEIMKLAKGIKD